MEQEKWIPAFIAHQLIYRYTQTKWPARSGLHIRQQADVGIMAGSSSPTGSDSSSDCTCNAGYFGPIGGPCTACVAGKYRAWSAASSVESNCLHCDSGKYSPAASGACLDCEVGKRAPDKGMGACIECEHGNRCRARISAIPCAAGEL